LEKARRNLFEVRKKRVHRHEDNKILRDWNGLMIAALTKGSRALNEPRYAHAAARATEFMLKKMWGTGGKLLHRYRAGRGGISENVDDYAFLIWGLIEVYEASFEVRYLQTALELNTDLLKFLWEDQSG